ncbi:glycosyltransferase family 4 protein [Paraconexibacter antarcticus]|uniref:Glycosyltransferase family 4 protein n=1 Tax=Paraconexibacter antarcticus TaxID=2949664 RepID=A0ABY5DLC0_9ACTN|nr:glycosyltransferase family 4 protein [Paraconexibacter antarcticus]UTI62618.1 glycosyltransferase family 4 protein [Paraconexibacter antarcticus]
MHDQRASSPARPGALAETNAPAAMTGPEAAVRPRRIQLWSYNYDPEPTGIGPVSRTWALAMQARGHDVSVVAAHPHYPSPDWGTRVLPYREEREGIRVLRLPLWIGRSTARERVRQEASFMAAQFAAIPALGRPDVAVVVSPSFPALLPAIVGNRARRTPWILWLHDILPDAAAVTGLLDEQSKVIRASRRLERAAYRHADRIVVLSSAFTDNLTAKGVPADKLRLIYDPATRVPVDAVRERSSRAPRILCMGNIGFSQGLTALVGAFEADPAVAGPDVRLVITGNGLAADDVRAQITTDRVEMLGVVSSDRLEQELQQADIGLVTQHHEGGEFNIPSKLMNFMAYGLPVLAAVNPAGEVARIVEASGAGWVVDSSDPGALPRAVARIAADPEDQRLRSQRALAWAHEHYTAEGFARRFDAVIGEVC